MASNGAGRGSDCGDAEDGDNDKYDVEDADKYDVEDADDEHQKSESPLDFNEILEDIFDFLDLEDLLRCRLTCKKWLSTATPIVRKKGPLLRFMTPLQTKFCGVEKSSGGQEQSLWEVHMADKWWELHSRSDHAFNKELPVNPGSFVDTMRQSSDVPCSKISIEVRDNLEEYDDLISAVWGVVTNLQVKTKNTTAGVETLEKWLKEMKGLKTLEISRCQILGVDALFSSEEEIVLDSLTKLQINFSCSESTVNPSFARDLFSRTPNLKTLKLSAVDDKSRKIIEDDVMIDAIARNNICPLLQNLTDTNLRTLKKMELACLSNAILEAVIQLVERGMKLKSFKLKNTSTNLLLCIWDESITENLHKLLEKLKPNLECLVLANVGCNDNFFLTLSDVMPRLTTLKILAPNVFTIDRPICYNKQFPVLKNLHVVGGIKDRVVENFFNLTYNAIPSKSIRKLRFTGSLVEFYNEDNEEDKSIVETLAKLFPKITNLDFRRPALKDIQAICKGWPNLVRLRVVGFHGDDFLQDPEDTDFEFLDPGFTGIDYELCHVIGSNRVREDGEGEDWVPGDGKSSIVDLTDLRHFRLDCISLLYDGLENGRAGVTSNALIYGALIKMKGLKTVTITEWIPEGIDRMNMSGYTSDITQEAVVELQKALPETAIKVISRWKPCFNYDYGMEDLHSMEDYGSYADLEDVRIREVDASTVLHTVKLPLKILLLRQVK